MILSTALCRPTSSAVSTMSPSSVHSAAACRPPVAANVSWSGARRAGSARIASASTVRVSDDGRRGQPRRRRDRGGRTCRTTTSSSPAAGRRAARPRPPRAPPSGSRRRRRPTDRRATATMSATAVTIPSVNRKPAASSRSAPGVRIVTENGWPFSRTSSAASTATSSVDASRVDAVADAHHRDALHPLASGHGRQDNIGRSMSFFGLGQQKPHHYREMVRIVWENRDQLPFAWRILTRGVCDGCALGTTGVRDWTLPGTHLCMVRLELLRLNTAPALDPGVARRRVDAGRPVLGGPARPRPAAGADAAAARRARLPRRRAGTRRWRSPPTACAPPIRGGSPSTSPRAASPTRSTTRRRRRRASSAPTTSTTRRGCATPRRPWR